MKKNKMYSAMLSILLIVSGQVLASEPLSLESSTILSKMWFMPSMPAAPDWVTNFVNNLSDSTKQYLWYGTYGALGFLLTYIGYRALKGTSSGSGYGPAPIAIGNKRFWSIKHEELSCNENCSNIAYIIKDYDMRQECPYREPAFRKYVCPVLMAHQTSLNSQEKWKAFLFVIPYKAVDIILGDSVEVCGLKIFKLINKTCPNETITNPLKALLLEASPGDKELLQILSQ